MNTNTGEAGQSRHDWEDPHVLARHREPAHATLVPFADPETALQGERGTSRFFKLLNGRWQFHYATSPAEVPDGFETEAFTAEGWDSIPVPSNWQMLGTGKPNYLSFAQNNEDLGRSEQELESVQAASRQA